MLVFFSKGMVIHKEIRDLKDYRRKTCKVDNLISIFNVPDHEITKIKVLNCQHRLLLYLKHKKSKSRGLFTNFAVIDLFKMIGGKGLGNAKGYEKDYNLCANFDGSIVFSITKDKPEEKKIKFKITITWTYVKALNNGYDNFFSKNKWLRINEIDEFKSIPPALCYSCLLYTSPSPRDS